MVPEGHVKMIKASDVVCSTFDRMSGFSAQHDIDVMGVKIVNRNKEGLVAAVYVAWTDIEKASDNLLEFMNILKNDMLEMPHVEYEEGQRMRFRDYNYVM